MAASTIAGPRAQPALLRAGETQRPRRRRAQLRGQAQRLVAQRGASSAARRWPNARASRCGDAPRRLSPWRSSRAAGWTRRRASWSTRCIRSSTHFAPARHRRPASASSRAAIAARSGATSAAAAVGVAARASATKSQIVKSVSCPTADTTGSAESSTARATALLVERPQVLDRAAAAPDDQHVDFAPCVGGADGGGDLGRRAGALDAAGIDDHRERGPAARERRQHVVQRRRRAVEVTIPTARGNAGSGRLRSSREPAGRLEPRLEAGELLVQRAQAGEADRLDVELELAARFVDRRRGAQLDGEAVPEREARMLRLVAKEHAGDLRRGVLEVEVAVPGGGPREAGDLPGDPEQADLALDDAPGRRHQQRNRDDCRRGSANCDVASPGVVGQRASPSSSGAPAGRRPQPRHQNRANHFVQDNNWRAAVALRGGTLSSSTQPDAAAAPRSGRFKFLFLK